MKGRSEESIEHVRLESCSFRLGLVPICWKRSSTRLLVSVVSFHWKYLVWFRTFFILPHYSIPTCHCIIHTLRTIQLHQSSEHLHPDSTESSAFFWQSLPERIIIIVHFLFSL